jgi:hypothetical protein
VRRRIVRVSSNEIPNDCCYRQGAGRMLEVERRFLLVEVRASRERCSVASVDGALVDC